MQTENTEDVSDRRRVEWAVFIIVLLLIAIVGAVLITQWMQGQREAAEAQASATSEPMFPQGADISPPPRVRAPPPEPTAPAPEAPAVEASAPAVAQAPAAEPVPELMTLAAVPEDTLDEALRRGDVRLGTPGDVTRWYELYRRQVPGSGPLPDSFQHMEVMVVQREMRVPPGLSGANAVIFVVPKGVPLPSGDAGHSPVLDMASGACRGVTCRMMLRDR